MDRNLLNQYVELKAEIKDIKKRIQQLDKEIEAMERDGYLVSDTVKGTREDGTYGIITITGFPFPMYYSKKQILECRKDKLEEFEKKQLLLLGEVDDFINQVEDSRIRRILRYKYLDDMNWVQVACHMGGKHTADSCRMACNKFLKEFEKTQSFSR